MLYEWMALNQQGQLRHGCLQMGSQKEAIRFIKDNYGCVLELRAVEQGKLGKIRSLLNWNQLRFSDKERVIFFERLAIILSSGIPLIRGLRLMQAQNHGTIGKASQKLEIAISEGGSLAKAMKSYDSLFPPLTVNLIEVGEKSGELCRIAREIANYYRKQLEFREFILKNSLYPIFVLSTSLGVLMLFVSFILPVLADTYKALGIPITGVMYFSIALKQFLQENLYLDTFLAGCALILIFRNRSFLQGLLWEMPLLKNINKGSSEIRFCKLVALLLECGVNITEAVADISTTFKDTRFVKQLWIFSNMLKRGENIGIAAQCMEKFLSPITIEMMTIGAATGYLPKLLNEAAKISEENMRATLERMKEVLGPALLLITALIVGVVVVSVIQPLLDLFANLPKYI